VTTRSVLRAAAAVAVAALLVGPSAHAAPRPHQPAGPPAAPAYGHDTHEWLMMGRACGASIS
jgi:hypothetical protein